MGCIHPSQVHLNCAKLCMVHCNELGWIGFRYIRRVDRLFTGAAIVGEPQTTIAQFVE